MCYTFDGDSMNKRLTFYLILCVLAFIFILVAIIKKIRLKFQKNIKSFNNMNSVNLSYYINIINSFPEVLKIRKKTKIWRWIGNAFVFLTICSLVIALVLCKIKKFVELFVLFTLLFIFTPFLVIFCYYKSEMEGIDYNKLYKENVITTLLKNIDPNILYKRNGLERNEKESINYDKGNFEDYDTFSSEDMIVSHINNIPFILSDIEVKKKYTDTDGNSHYDMVFSGTFAFATLPKSINATIVICDNRWLFQKKDSYVQIDNTEFENKYDVFSDNNIIAMRILTPTLTTNILDIQKQTTLKMEVKIINNLIFFRFHGSNLFEPSLKNTELEAYNAYESICKYNTIKSIINEIVNNVNNLEM